VRLKLFEHRKRSKRLLNRFWCPDIVRAESLLCMPGLDEQPFINFVMHQTLQSLINVRPGESSMDNCRRFVYHI
jgi:hypothetical protein